MKKLFLILLSTLTTLVYSQTIRLTYETGYGIYGLDNLKRYQESLTHQVNELAVKMIAQFPDYFNHSASIGFYLDKNVIFGFNTSFLSTGGRNQISDYSGEYKLDMLLHAYQFGIESEYIYNVDSKWDMNFNIKMGIVSSTININESVTIYDLDSITNTQSVHQGGVFIEPNINLSYNIYKGIALKAGLGLNLNTATFQGSMLDWTGIRPRLGISYSL
ncbi:MAG: hypothetical protein WC542_12060 [Paludibacter sp.]